MSIELRSFGLKLTTQNSPLKTRMLPVNLPTNSQLLEGQLKGLENDGANLKAHAKNDHKKLVGAAKNFESFMYSYMFKEMYKSVPKSEVFGETSHQDVFMGMYMDEVSKQSSLSKNGLAAQLVKQYENQMLSNEEINEINVANLDVNSSVSGKLGALSEKFGQDGHLANTFKDFDAMIDKVEDKISSKYGMRNHPISHKNKFHEGVDFALNEGTPIFIPSKGKVAFVGENGGYGNSVIIDHGQGVTTLYAHLSEMSVKEGDILGKNALIGKVGSTGVSTGPHLHFEVRKDGKTIDPMHLVSK